jgi:hypothetical protein
VNNIRLERSRKLSEERLQLRALRFDVATTMRSPYFLT